MKPSHTSRRRWPVRRDRAPAPSIPAPNRLRVLRAGFKLSQRATALRSGIGEWRYWRIENQAAEATPDERRAIARTLRATIAEAFPRSRRRAPGAVDKPAARGAASGDAAHV